MSNHAVLFAIKMMLKSLPYSSAKVDPLISKINDFIDLENNDCTQIYRGKLTELNDMIDENI